MISPMVTAGSTVMVFRARVVGWGGWWVGIWMGASGAGVGEFVYVLEMGGARLEEGRRL